MNRFTGWTKTVSRYKVFSILLLYFISANAYAADIQTILTNLSGIIVPFTLLALMISFAAGILMVIQALAAMKKFGSLGMNAQPGELGGPFMKLIVGTVLIYLPTSTDILTETLFGTGGNSIFGGGGNINFQATGTGSSLLSYTGGGSLGSQWASMANTLVLFIQFLGLLSFLKGWFILAKSAGHGAQPGNFGKGVTHIIGGIIAINFVTVVNIIMNTVYGT